MNCWFPCDLSHDISMQLRELEFPLRQICGKTLLSTLKNIYIIFFTNMWQTMKKCKDYTLKIIHSKRFHMPGLISAVFYHV